MSSLSHPKTPKPLYRAFPLSIAHLTKKKRRAIAAILEAYRPAVRFYLESLWKTPGGLDQPTVKRFAAKSRLTARFKNAATRQALGVIAATKTSAQELGIEAGRPTFHGAAQLDAKFVTIEPAEDLKGFDLVVRLVTLKKRRLIELPIKATSPLREALAVPGARLIQGANLSEDRLTLIVELPRVEHRPLPVNPEVLGLDVGYHTLVATSEGQLLGTDFGEIAQKIRRRKPGSKGKKRALLHRDAAVVLLGLLHDGDGGRAARRLFEGGFCDGEDVLLAVLLGAVAALRAGARGVLRVDADDPHAAFGGAALQPCLAWKEVEEWAAWS